MALDLQAQTILKIGFLFALVFLLGYLVFRLMILDETINIMMTTNQTFI